MTSRSDWQLDNEFSTSRRVLSSVDASLMVRDDPVHYGEPETSSAPLCREIRLKELLQMRRIEPATIVAYLNDDNVTRRVVPGRDGNSTAVLAAFKCLGG